MMIAGISRPLMMPLLDEATVTQQRAEHRIMMTMMMDGMISIPFRPAEAANHDATTITITTIIITTIAIPKIEDHPVERMITMAAEEDEETTTITIEDEIIIPTITTKRRTQKNAKPT